MSFEPGRYRVSALSMRILIAPDYEATLDDQALLGEEVEVLGSEGEFTQVLIPDNGKTGWVPAAAQKLIPVNDGLPALTHRVRTQRAVTFRKPDPETETMLILPLNAQITLDAERVRYKDDEFARILGHSVDAWIRTSVLMPAGQYEPDFVAVQEELERTPYVWGGRDSTVGVDCSALLLLSLQAAGYHPYARDTRDLVESPALGEELAFPPRGYGLQRGDILFTQGHVVTLISHNRCIHATDLKPHHRVVVQDLDTMIRERTFAKKKMDFRVRRLARYKLENTGLVA